MGPESVAMDSGEKRLLDLGYKQELRRTLSYEPNFIHSINSEFNSVDMVVSQLQELRLQNVMTYSCPCILNAD